MVIWIDAQLSPALATWMNVTFGVEAVAVKDLGLRDAADPDIFTAAAAAGAVVLTKDADFVTLLMRYGPPPRVVWLTCGNTSNVAVRTLLATAWPRAHGLLDAGEALVELSDRAQMTPRR